MRTLHLYFARELVKTFLMTSLALTLMVVMGGGVANIFKGEGIGPEEVAKVFAFLTPVAVTLILPVAALFSATITYGRAAADNEITACRAAGINIHRLLLSAGVLGFSVTVFTYWSWNYLIPQLSKQIEDTTRNQLHAIVVHQFQKAKPLAFGKYRISATSCRVMRPEELPPDTPSNHTYLTLSGVSFLEVENQEALRFGTADLTIVDFDQEERSPRVTADLLGVRSYDAQRNQYYELERQTLGPMAIPLPIRHKIKFENLPALMAYRKSPASLPDIDSRYGGLKRAVMEWLLHEDLLDHLDPRRPSARAAGKGETSAEAGGAGGGTYVLEDAKRRYRISAEAFKVDPDTGRPTLGKVRVTEENLPTGPRYVYNADEAAFELRSGLRGPDRPVVMIQLRKNVATRELPAAEGRRPRGAPAGEREAPVERVVKKDSVTLHPVEYFDQPELSRRYESIDLASLLESPGSLGMPPMQTRQLEKLNERAQQLLGEVRSEIHFRASYAVSVVGMVLLGAVLGIIVRGGQVLTAFGISCIPTLFVVIACIVGRNLGDRVPYAAASIAVMWAAAAFMYLATAFIAVNVLRR
jgi:lipopolysaccharide export LptBFGC system permease protein LptF